MVAFPEPREGLYFDLPEEAYHADPALGSTDVKNLRTSGPDYWWNSPHNPDRPKRNDTPYQEFGTAFHVRVLYGKQAFESQYVRRPDDLVTLTAKARAELCPNGEIVLKGEDYDRIQLLANLVGKTPDLAEAFEGGAPEVSVFWREIINGSAVPCKARFDYLKKRGIGDLKSIRNYRGRSFPEACANAINEYRYDIQAAHYLAGRSHLARFVRDGLVHGDHSQEWLLAAAASEFAFQIVFFQADSAPIGWTRVFSPGNSVLDIATQHRAQALETYVSYMSKFGPDKMWLLDIEVCELDIEEMPKWYSR
jgi:hypothetical protein